MTPPSPVVRHITTASVVVVAGIGAVVSYSHMQQLAGHAGEGWRSWLVPLSIDGLVVAASMVLLTRRRTRLPGGKLAWGALAAGVLASLAANMADARPEIIAVLVAGWPAAAFAVAFELLLQQRRADRAGLAVPTRPASLVPSIPATPAPFPAGWGGSPRTTSASGPSAPLRSRQPLDESAPRPGAPPREDGARARGGSTSHGDEPTSPAPGTPAVAPASPAPAVASPLHRPAPAAKRQRQPASASRQCQPAGEPGDASDLVNRVRPLVNEGLGRQVIAQRLGITQHQARQAIDKVKAGRPALQAVGGAR